MNGWVTWKRRSEAVWEAEEKGRDAAMQTVVIILWEEKVCQKLRGITT